MAEPDFERTLVALFADAPPMADAEAFARRVEGRLESGWQLRRVVIGGMGVAGGLVAAAQMASASLQLRAGNVSLPSWRDVSHQVNVALGAPAASAGLSADTLVLSACLAVVAVVLGVTRMVRAI